MAELAERYRRTRATDDEALKLGVVYQNDGERERVTSAFVLSKIIGIPTDRQAAEHGKRLGLTMRAAGWDGPKAVWIGGRTTKGYERPVREPEPWEQ